VKAALNRGLIASVVAGEPLLESKLAPLGAGGGLPPQIEPGTRALSVKVNEVIGVAGFVVPGTRVDVFVTIGMQNEAAARLVVSNVQVLTAGTKFDQEEAKKDAKPIPTTVVTLMVTPRDAERIILAANQGQIMLALRNPLDTKPTQTPGVSTSSLLAGAPAPTPTSGVTPAPQPRRVEAIRGGKRTREVIR
jgi:pilus assembly protein CpaB